MEQQEKTHSLSFREEFPCSYFDDGRSCCLEYIVPGSEGKRNYHEFLAEGYRRAGNIFYRTVCRGCAECLPLRLETDRFVMSRSQKRTFRKNRDIRVHIHTPALVTPEKIELYRKYLQSKHPERTDNTMKDHENQLSVIHYCFESTIEMDYYLYGKLIGVGIIDEASDTLSSNYFYYDTDFLKRRLGVYSVLRELFLAQTMQKKYYYLGFYIRDNPKMSYKKHFGPNQIYDGQRWKDFL